MLVIYFNIGYVLLVILFYCQLLVASYFFIVGYQLLVIVVIVGY